MPRLLVWIFSGALIVFVASWVLAWFNIDTLVFMRLALATVASVAALSCIASVFARPGAGNIYWKGTRMPCGLLAALGFAIAFGSFAIVMAAYDLIGPYGIWFGVAFIAGWLLCVVGYVVDTYHQSSAPANDQGQPPVEHPRVT
jgi:hypothetical protein